MHCIIIKLLIKSSSWDSKRKKKMCTSNWGTLILLVLKENCKTFRPMSRIRPVTAKVGTPMTNIQPPLCTAPDLCKIVTMQCYLVATAIHIPSPLSQMCVYICVYVCVCVCIYIYIYITKLRGLSPHANYTDRAAAAGRRS